MTFPFPTFVPGGASYVPPTLAGTVKGSTVNNQSSIGVTLPSGIVAGERLFIMVSGQAGAVRTVTTPSGWTNVYSDSAVSGQLRFVALFTKIATGSEGASQTVSFSGGTNCAALAWRVAGSVDNCVASTRNVASVTEHSFPALTPGGNAQLWFAVLHRLGSQTATQPSGYTSGGYSSYSSSVSSMFAYREISATSETPGTWGSFATAQAGSSVTIAIW